MPMMISADAPKPLPPGSRVGIIAGEGRLPLDVAEQAKEAGYDPLVVFIGREEMTEPGLLRFEHRRLALEDGASLIPLLKQHRVTHAVMAGAVTRRPKLTSLRPSLSLLRMSLSVLPALARGDDGLLRSLVAYVEKQGIKVLGAHEIIPALVAEAGLLTRAAPDGREKRNLAAAWEAAGAIGALDIGQAAVAIGGRVIALEGIEGTDGLLERTRSLRGHGRLAGASGGVLVKRAKPQQELRADLPTIGPQTVADAAAAGLAGIGVEAGRSLIIDRGGVVAEADRLGLFVIGLS